MKRILLVGNGFSGLTHYLRERGYEYIVLKDQLRANDPDKKLKRRVLCDFSSIDKIKQAVDSITEPIDAVMTIYESYVLPASWISQHLGLPGMPTQAAEACTDKFLMRQLFAQAPQKISPDFAIVKSEDDLKAFASSHTFPLILKPANLAKSLLVTKNHDLDELLANYQRSLEQIGRVYARYAAHRTPALLVEEFLQGPSYSVDAFIGTDGEPMVLEQVVDYKTGYEIGYEDNFQYSRFIPSALPAADQQALRECAAMGIKALGMQNSPAHVEVIMTPGGPRIVEIGARNGGYRERMHRLADGINLLDAALKVALCEKPDIVATKHDACAVLELFPKVAGNFAGIRNEEALRQLPTLEYFDIKPAVGQFVGKSADGYKMCAVVILHSPDAAALAKDVAWITNEATVITEPRTD